MEYQEIKLERYTESTSRKVINHKELEVYLGRKITYFKHRTDGIYSSSNNLN